MKKTKIAIVLCCVAALTAGCISDGPLPADDDSTDPDAGAPVDEPDACPPDDPDASTTPAPTLTVTANPSTITVGGTSTISWDSTNTTSCWSSADDQDLDGSWSVSPTETTTYSLTCHGTNGMDVTGSAIVTVNPSPLCEIASDCNDGLSWTDDACNSNGTCAHWPIDCGGMQERLPATAVSCQFWGGFGISEPAPSLGVITVGNLATGASGGSWKASPQHACSAKCYDGNGAEVSFDEQYEWNGNTFQHQQLDGRHKATWDGKNTY